MNDNWIEWTAEDHEDDFEAPVADYVMVEIMMIDGEMDVGRAGAYNWGLTDEAGQIVAYRIATPRQEQVERLSEVCDLNPEARIIRKDVPYWKN